jgi:hypothetical protein
VDGAELDAVLQEVERHGRAVEVVDGRRRRERDEIDVEPREAGDLLVTVEAGDDDTLQVGVFAGELNVQASGR